MIQGGEQQRDRHGRSNTARRAIRRGGWWRWRWAIAVESASMPPVLWSTQQIVREWACD